MASASSCTITAARTAASSMVHASAAGWSAPRRGSRAGDSVFLLSADTRRTSKLAVKLAGDMVLGPALQDAMGQASRAAQHGRTLHITGESGSGKEGIARAFHNGSSGQGGPFVAINCATIATGLAERLLFGARRGTYSGAMADSEGLINRPMAAPCSSTDRRARPGRAGQALRVLETREGPAARRAATAHRECSYAPPRIATCAAKSPAGASADLYFRLSRPEVEVPPLRRRLKRSRRTSSAPCASSMRDCSRTAHSSRPASCDTGPATCASFRRGPRRRPERARAGQPQGRCLPPLGRRRPNHRALHRSAALCALAFHPAIARAGNRPPSAPKSKPPSPKPAATSAPPRASWAYIAPSKRVLEKYGLAGARSRTFAGPGRRIAAVDTTDTADTHDGLCRSQKWSLLAYTQTVRAANFIIISGS